MSLALWATLALAGLSAGISVSSAAQGGPGPPELAGGVAFDPPKTIDPFALRTHEDRPFGPDQLEGRWTFMFFGYTHCPDVCPNTLGILSAALRRLVNKHRGMLRDTQIVFVSIDPQRDTPEKLAEYLPYFNQSFVGVTGPPAEIARFARSLGIRYARNEGPGGEYFMEHSTNIVLFDKTGRVSALLFAPHTAQNLASDLLRARRY